MPSTTNWNGFRELVLIRKEEVCPSIISFYFKPTDKKPLINYKAGQFLPFRIKTDDPKYKNVIRTYSLSLLPNENIYRISVKKVEGGLISTMLHEQLEVGDVIEAMPPAGVFTINEEYKNKPLVLISAGIGITPLLSMLYDEVKSRQDIHFIQAVQNSQLHPFSDNIEQLAQIHGFKNTIFYSNPLDCDQIEKDYHVEGFVTKDWIKENLLLDADFYFCGPPPFMLALEKSLLELGVSKDNINYEFFSKK